MSRVKTVALAAGRDNIALPQIYFRRLRCCSAEVVKWLLVGWGRSTLWDRRCRCCARGVNGLAGPSPPPLAGWDDEVAGRAGISVAQADREDGFVAPPGGVLIPPFLLYGGIKNYCRMVVDLTDQPQRWDRLGRWR